MNIQKLLQFIYYEASDCLSINQYILSIVKVFLKRALSMFNYKIVEEFKKKFRHRISNYVLLTKLHQILLIDLNQELCFIYHKIV